MPSTATSELDRSLEALADRLRTAAGDALVMAAVYGSAARGDHRPGRSDVNLLLVLARADRATLDALVPVIGEARGALRLAPFVLTREELGQAADSFAAKLADVRLAYKVLLGDDLLAPLEIRFADLRLACERELRNVALRLRRAYLLGDARPALRRDALDQLLPHLYGSLRVLLARTGGTPPLQLDALAREASKAFGCAAEPLVEAARVRVSEAGDDAIKAVYPPLFESLATIVGAVDQLTE